MSIITKPADFRGMTGYCYACGKKLPKKLAYWCNASCWNKYLDKLPPLETSGQGS